MLTPTHTITPHSIDIVARIAEKVGELKGFGEHGRNFACRKLIACGRFSRRWLLKTIRLRWAGNGYY
jgi:hypothetical protein